MPCSDELQGYAVRDLLEAIAGQVDDLGKGIEDLQGIAGELAAAPEGGIPRELLMRLQLIDRVAQQIAALPGLVRALKSGVPEDLALNAPDSRRAYAVALAACRGASAARPAEAPGSAGECELWHS